MPPRAQSSSQAVKFPWETNADLPDPQTDIKKWVKVTDDICARRFDPSQPLPIDVHRGQPESKFANDTNENVLQEMVGARRFACASQLRLSRNATRLFTEDEFEEKWIALGSEKQEKHILNAFKSQEAGPPDPLSIHGPAKLNCPELRIDLLLKDDGKGFLDFLKMFLLENNDVPPTQPLVFPNKRFDDIIGWDDAQNKPTLKAWLELRRVLRTNRLEAFCMHVLASYHGTEIQNITFAHEHSKTKTTLAGMKPMVDQFMTPSERKQWMKEQASARKEQNLYCDNCLKPENKDEGKMSVCTKCKAIGREVRYCSKECQRAAWKAHKRGCGKPLDVDAVFEDVNPIHNKNAVSSRIDIPSAAPGFRRSPDLLRLIGMLNDFPAKDYLIILPSNPRDPEVEGISLDELHGCAVFIIMRNRSMYNADLSALYYMYRVLQKFEATAGGAQILKRQLKKEYGDPFQLLMKKLDSNNPPPAPEVTTEDVDKVLGFLKKMGRFEEELVDYEPGNVAGKKTINAGIQVGPKKDLMVVVKWPKDAAPPTAIVTPIPAKAKIRPARALRAAKSQDEAIHPNHSDSTDPHIDGITRSAALKTQLKLLAENSTVDYILWGNEDLPTVPHAVTFNDFFDCMAFLHFRRRLFYRGAANDPDSLVGLIMTLQPIVRRRKISKATLCEQLGREHGTGHVDEALGCIKGKQYHRKRDGKVFTLEQIPANKSEFAELPEQLKAAGRFPEILAHWRSES